jgi:hypothetical protein
MITAYNSYKASLLKVKSTRQKKDPNDIQSMLDMIGKTMLRISALDSSAWTDHEKGSFCEALAGFKAEIEGRLAGSPGNVGV